MAGRSFVGVSYRTLAFLRKNLGTVCLSAGERALAEQQWQETTDLGAKTRDAELMLLVARIEPIRRLIDGDIEAALNATEALRVLAAEVGSSGYGRRMATYEALRPLLRLGRAQDALDSWALEGREPGRIRVDAPRAVCLAHIGRSDQVREILDRHCPSGHVLAEDDHTPAGELSLLLEAAVLVSCAEQAGILAQRLVPFAGLPYIDERNGTCVARHLGAAAVLLGDSVQAEAYYRQALEACGKLRFRSEIALTRLQLAELLLDHHPQWVARPRRTSISPSARSGR